MLAAIRAFLTLYMFIRVIWFPVAGIAFLAGMFLLQCGNNSRHKTEKRVIEHYPEQMWQLRNWRLK